jgi:phage terminase large subunit GpA-like protein
MTDYPDFELITGLFDGLRPEPRLKVSEWADRHRYLSPVAAAEPGRYRTSRTPFLREIMDRLSSDDPCQEIYVMKGAQIGFTEAGNNAIGYWIDNAPGSILMVMPTDEAVKKNSRMRIDPMIQATPRLTQKVAAQRSRDASNTTNHKDFPGGVLTMTGANSAVGLRSTPVRYLFLDEVDGYPHDLDGEGSPVELAKKRTATYSKRKIFAISTPTIAGLSTIEEEFLNTDQRYYHVPCPDCGHKQPLVFRDESGPRLVWEKGRPETVRFACEGCGSLIEERHKPAMLAAGEWIASVPELSSPAKYGYHLNSLYSPLGWYSWEQAARDWEDAQDKPTKLKTFVNTVLGETWKERGEVPDWQKLYNRREAYEFNRPPKDVAFITVGVDVQKDRLEAQVIGWGKRKRSWSIDYRVFMGDTSAGPVWDQLAAMIGETWEREDGVRLPMLMMGVDTGYNTQHAYDFCRRFDANKVVPVKGQDNQMVMLQPPKVIDMTRDGKRVGHIRLWNVASSMIKSELYGWLRAHVGDDGIEPDGYVHFPMHGEGYFKGLTAEKLTLVKNRKGYSRYEWVKEYERNEPLDTYVYARAAAGIFGIDRMTEEEYDRLVMTYGRGRAERPKRTRDNDFWN